MSRSVEAGRTPRQIRVWRDSQLLGRAHNLLGCVQAGSPVCQVLFSCHGNGTEMSANTVSIAANGAFKCVSTG